jgi:hypothetical protein
MADDRSHGWGLSGELSQAGGHLGIKVSTLESLRGRLPRLVP